MFGNTLLLTTVIFLGLAFFLMGECHFLIPYRHLMWVKYGGTIALYVAVLFVNLFAGLYVIGRKLFLKDTGRKLAHLEKQLRTGSSLSEELSRRLQE
jgi:hypothetical protein